MFQLLQPIWLYALTGLSAPVIIHLWNQRPGKTLKVGSTFLVAERLQSDKKKIQLSEWLLLLLRCLLLACIAIALARPVWRSPADTASKGWILMDRQSLTTTYKRFQPQVDALLTAGMEFHYFEEGFKKEPLEKALQTVADSSRAETPSYRNMIASLNEQVSATLPVYIFTDNYLRHFKGSQTAVSLNLHWMLFTPDTVAAPTATDTTVVRICIFSSRYVNDARYLKAALDAIQQFSKKNILITSVTAIPQLPTGQDWLFWLDDAPPVDGIAQNIVAYTKGKPVKQSCVILPAGDAIFGAVDLYQSVIETNTAITSTRSYWQDGYGHPILTARKQNNTTTNYQLYTHIDPSWNELPWTDDFPAMLYKLLYQVPASELLGEANDQTTIDSLQAMPIVLKGKATAPKQAVFFNRPLTDLFWLGAFILLLLERCLSFYYHQSANHG